MIGNYWCLFEAVAENQHVITNCTISITVEEIVFGLLFTRINNLNKYLHLLNESLLASTSHCCLHFFKIYNVYVVEVQEKVKFLISV